MSQKLIDNLMSQSSVPNRVKTMTNAEEKDIDAEYLDTNVGFSDLIDREGESCFVDRVDKQQQIKDLRASACSQTSRRSAMHSRNSSLTEKERAIERQNSRKRRLEENRLS